jgi:ubiquitin C-terminal hydrolase
LKDQLLHLYYKYSSTCIIDRKQRLFGSTIPFNIQNNIITTTIMSAVVLSPLPMTSSSSTPEEYDDDDIMMNLFESTAAVATSDDASVPSLSEDDIVMEDVADETLGGLRNLGNTCYLNSATQMLASLDHHYFVAALEATAPVDQDKLVLRDEFIQLMTALRSGETVHPASFKQAVDQRSPLFVGYRQQDAHEFLTTLLDLLDEAYQVPVEVVVPVPEQVSNSDTATTTADATAATTAASCSTDESESKPESVASSQEEEAAPAMETDATVEDATVEDATVEDATVEDATVEDATVEDATEESMSCIQSYSGLKVEEISKLLHGDEEQEQKKLEVVAAAKLIDEPQCKLIGGRAVVTDSAAPCLLKSSEEATLLPPAASRPAADNNSNATSTTAIPAAPTPIDDYFCTKVRSRLTCDSCKYSRTQMEKYLHLSIDISSSCIEEGLRKFFAPERRDIKCEKCFCESATQSTEITKLPPALLIHFKRFIVDVSPDYSSVTYRKNQSPVDFSETLPLDAHSVLREFMADDVTVPTTMLFGDAYQIRSIVNHIGSSASCGHYTADGNRLYANGERNWTRFNDSNVSRISSEEAMSQATKKTAYMVMYELGGAQ